MKVVDSKQIEQTSCTFDNLKPERVYTCQVISHYEKNDKESEQVEIQTSPGNGLEPQHITLQEIIESPSRTLCVHWEKPKHSGYVQGYKCLLFEDGNKKEVRSEKKSATEHGHEFPNLKSNVKYYCEVISMYHSKVEGKAYSNTIETNLDKYKPPENVTAEPDSTNPFLIHLEWDQPEDTPAVDEYIAVLTHAGGMEVSRKRTTEKFVTFTDLETDTTYQCKVIAHYQPKDEGYSCAVVEARTSGESLAPQKVKLENKSYRRLCATWVKPSFIKMQLGAYECRLCEADSDQTTIWSSKNAFTYTHEFANLRTNTKYYCEVIAKYGRLEKAVKSDTVITNKAERTGNFNITETGKPTDVRCKMSDNPGHNLQISWLLGDIGSEVSNYDCTGTQVRISSGSDIRSKKDEKCDNSYTFDKLLRGVNYKVEVKTTFIDLDTRQDHSAVEYATFTTDMSKLMNIEVKWDKKNIEMTWTKVDGAQKYRVIVKSEDGNSIMDLENTQHNTHSFPMMKLCNYGKTCEFVVIAVAKTNQTTQSSVFRTIGGDNIPTNVHIEQNQTDPRRRLDCKWKAPKNDQALSNYEVTLCGSDGTTMTKETNEVHYTFSGLLPSTEYHFKMIAVHHQHENSSECVSEPFSTLPRQDDDQNIGTVEVLSHKIKDLRVTLTWMPVKLNENYTLKHYHVKIESADSWRVVKLASGWMSSWWTNIENKTVGTETTYTTQTLEEGKSYDAKLTCTYTDKDTKEDITSDCSYIFSTKPCSTSLNDCTLKDGLVTFSWEPVESAKEYRLEIKDEFQKHGIIDKTNSTTNWFETEINEELRVGKAYMIRVTVFGQDGQTTSTEWEKQLIGGKDVPRNVTASCNKEYPYRVVNIQFDRPDCQETPHSYVITAEPTTGKKRAEKYTKSPNDIKFKYLRSGVQYKFSVKACYENKDSEESGSKFVTTHSKNKNLPSVVNHSDVSKSTINYQGVTLQNTQNIINAPSDTFGQVINLNHKVDQSSEKDAVSISWDSPAFNNCQDDYRVCCYEISIRNKSGKAVFGKEIEFVDGKYDYKVEDIKLDLGCTYTIDLKTSYEDIDEDKTHVSSAVKKSLHTRPCRPESLKTMWNESEIIVTWNSAQGADKYEVQIFKEENTKPVVANKVGGDKTEWRHDFTNDLGIGFGVSYKALVKAISDNGFHNSCATEFQIIGGDYVPRDVTATVKGVSDPNTETFVKWREPVEKPLSYKVKAITDYNTWQFTTVKCEQNHTTYNGLKPGLEYRFIVTAVHEDCESGGCKSNKVKTDPKPTPVKNVVMVSSTPTSISLQWDPVDSEKDGESTEYKIKIVAKDINQKHKLTVITENCTVDRLQPGILYHVTVAGGNSEGFGRSSDPVEVTTKLGKPKQVSLKCHDESPSNSLTVCFHPAEGIPEHYILNLYKINQKGVRKHAWGPEEKMCEEFQFENLEANTQYICGVKASYKKGDGEEVEANRCYTAPGKAHILHANAEKLSEEGEYSSNEVNVTWKTEEGCQKHEVRFKKLGKVESILAISNQNFCDYRCKDEATEYIVQVRSRNKSGSYGDWSDSKIIHLAPPAIKGISAQIEADHIKLEWSKPDEVSPDGYVIKVNNGESKYSDDTIYSYDPPLPSESYKFKICGLLKIPDGKTLAGIFTDSNAVVSKPGISEITDLKNCDNYPSSRFFVSWKKVEKCDMYEITVTSKSLYKVEAVLRQEGHLQTQSWYSCLRPGDEYSVTVTCSYNSILGNRSTKKTIQLVPGKVQIKKTDFDNKSLQVHWDQLPIKPSSYTVVLYEDGKEKAECIIGNESHVFDALHPGRRYYCTVAATNKAGSGEKEKTEEYSCAWIKPKHMKVTFDENYPSRIATISWEKPHGVDSFKLVICDDKIVLEKTLTDTCYTFKQGKPDHIYDVSLYCGCRGKYDEDCVSVTIAMAAVSPKNLKATPGKSSPESSLLVTFTDVQNISSTYKIVAVSQSDGKPLQIETSEQSALLEDLTPGDSYKISAQSFGPAGENFKTSKSCIEQVVQTVPGKLHGLKADATTHRVLATWKEPEFKPQEYKIRFLHNGREILSERTPDSHFTMRDIQPAQTYGFQVAAINCSGDGKWSDIEFFTTKPIPPINLQVKVNEDNPKHSFIVRFEDEKNSEKKYIITVFKRELGGNGEVEVDNITTSDHHAVISDLQPGTSYSISVKTVFQGMESEVVRYN